MMNMVNFVNMFSSLRHIHRHTLLVGQKKFTKFTMFIIILEPKIL